MGGDATSTRADGLRQGRTALLDPDGPGARLDAAGLRDALTELYECELLRSCSELGVDADSRYALLAFGGLGRRETMPHGDLDLVLVHDRRPDDEVARIADGLWYPLWDSGVTLDHSVRTVDQCLSVAADDLNAALGLLESRFVAGDTDLAALVRDGVHRQWRRQIPGRFDELVEAAAERRRRAGLIAHRMEPDLKNGEGGLRDTQLLGALAAAHLTDGVPAPVPGAPGADVDAAHRLVLDVRTELHRLTGRPRDVLYAQHADDVADALGMAGRFALARELSAAARTIAYATDVGVRTARAALPSRGLAARLRRSTTRRPLDEGLVEQGGEVVLARGVVAGADPWLLPRLAAAAARHRLPVGAGTLRRLAEAAPPPRGPWPPDALADLLVLLGSGEAQTAVVEALDRTGLWGRLFPEWGAVRDLPARDRTHVHTVDRHLVQTCVEASRLTTTVTRADLLLLAALLHDLGKGRDRDHSELGAEIAADVGARLGLDEGDVATLARVVRHHLLLAVTAARSDPDDPATADAVLTALEHDTRAFDVLAALGEADSLATGPGVWTDWRARIHRRLVDTCRARIAETAHADVAPPEVPAPRGGSAPGEGVTVGLRPTPGGHTHELEAWLDGSTEAVPALTRVLAAHGLDIVSADLVVEPGRHGRRLACRALVATRFGTPVDAVVLRQDVRLALQRGLTAQQRTALARREKAAAGPAQAPPSVRVRPRGDAPGLLVEIRTEDRPGLLGRVTDSLAGLGADLEWAVVRTRGAAVEDVLAVGGDGLDPAALADHVLASLPPADTLD